MGRNASIASEILAELASAQGRFKPFASCHEGWAVIHEEMTELWAEVCKHHGQRDTGNLRREAIQIAAMACRFVVDLCDTERGTGT